MKDTVTVSSLRSLGLLLANAASLSLSFSLSLFFLFLPSLNLNHSSIGAGVSAPHNWLLRSACE